MDKADKEKRNMSLDRMVKLFLQYYRIPTKKDLEKLMDRIDRLEKTIKTKVVEAGKIRGRSVRKKEDPGVGMTASDLVEEVIRASGDTGIGIPAIKDATGFEDKKLRNIIFRLNKLGRITRKSRGVYIVP
ncbi:hypothetical protein SAMN02745216_00532 [Desulfatibacillum alkenivorans DSM 16219]|uniref:Uncharacterized protein n=1 Tax=Desulfatibacillum alkenivorans DSM 16219 TaxID=1121393 RepID=A0A1M6E2S9_9BACT|nr:hypothetical protein [Desulfatibacillum alkenivorans]SHI79558.1 hypothetical protein SAMN02745216_00532 [Desulfatibacillum alkenivorans DSM 16219]